MASTTPGRRTPSSRSRSRDSKEAPRAAFAVQGASESARFFGVEGLLNDASGRRGSGASGVDHSGRSRSTGGIDEYSERSGIRDVSGGSNGNPFLGDSGRSGHSSRSAGSKERQQPARDASGRNGRSGEFGTVLEAGQDTAQGGGRTGVKPKNPFGSNNSSANSGPGNRAGPFGNDRSEESDDEADEAGPLTPEDIEEWHEASTQGGSHSVGTNSLDSLGEGGSLNSVGGTDGSKRNVNFESTSKRSGATAGDATAGNKQPRDKQFAGSAFTTTTTSSDDTRMMANTTGGGKKPYFNLSRAEEQKQFMEMMDGNGGGEVAGHASRANNGNGGTGGNGGGGGDVERGGNTYNTTSPLFEAADDDDLNIRTYKTRSSRGFNNSNAEENDGFDDGNDGSDNGNNGEHYASMQELLAHEKSQDSMFSRGYPRRRGRCGGCVQSCGGVLGQKGTRTRKIRLLVLVTVVVLCIVAVVAYIAVDQTSGDKGNVSESNLKAGEEGGSAPTPNGSPTRPGMVPSGPLPPAPSPPVDPGMPIVDSGDGFADLNLTWDFPSNSPVAAPSSSAPTASPARMGPSPRPTFMNNNNMPYSDPPYAQPTQSPTAPMPTTDFPTLSPESSSSVGGLPQGPPTMAPTGSETPTALASVSGIASPTAPPSAIRSAVPSSTDGSDGAGINATGVNGTDFTDNGIGVNATGMNGTAIDGTNLTDANATDFNATDVNATDVNATDVNATNINATDANTTNVEIPATLTITGANCSQNLTTSDYAAMTTAIEDEACDPANLAADVASCEVEEITSDDVECTAVSRRLRSLLSRRLAEDELVVAYKVLVTAVCAFGQCDDSEVYDDVKDSFTPAAIDDIVAALNDANPELIPSNATADVVWDDYVNATDVNATDVNATDVNATDVNATDFNATAINATDFNATDVNATETNATDIVAPGPNSTESNHTDASCLICPDGIATADGDSAECQAAIDSYAVYEEGSDACEQGKAYRKMCCSSAATNGLTLSCPNTLDESAQIDPNATLYYAVVPSIPVGANNGLFCARLEVENDGWIGFAISSAGKMDGSTGIIGLPAEDTVMKYDLRSYGVTPAPDTRQTLMETSLVQENGTTKMSFTKLLVEEGDVAIKEQGTNDFLHARGGATLGYHGNGNRFVVSLELVTAAKPLDTNATNSSSFNETDTSLPSMNATNFTDVNATDSNATNIEIPATMTIIGANCSQNLTTSDYAALTTAIEDEACDPANFAADVASCEVEEITSDDVECTAVSRRLRSLLSRQSVLILSGATATAAVVWKDDVNATDANATDFNTADVNATDVNATDVNATDANATGIVVPVPNATEANQTDASCLTCPDGIATTDGEDTLVVAYKVLVTAVCASGQCDDSDIYNGIKDSFTPAAIDDIVAALNGANSALIPSGATADVVWDDYVNATDVNATDVNATDLNATDLNATDLNATDVNATDVNATDFNATDFNATDFNATAVNATDFNATNVNATETNATAVNATDFNATGTSWNETEPISTNSSSIDGNATMNETLSMAVNASDANGTDHNETTIDMVTNGTINGTEPTTTNSSNIDGNATNSSLIDGNSTDVNGTDFTESSVNTTLPTNSNGTDGNVTANETMSVDTNSSDVTGTDLNGTASNITNMTWPDEAARLEALSYPYTMSLSRRGRSTLARYGSSVAMSQDGSIVVVGAKDATNDEKGSTGSLYIYSVDSADSDSLTQLQRLNGNEAKDEFGNSMALSRDGERLVVGSRSAQERRGGIQIFQRRSEQSSWELMKGGDIAGEVAGGRAGWAVSISADGNVVAMGSPTGGSDGGGSVVAYEYNDGTSDWEPYGSVLEGLPAGEAAGYSIALSDNGSAMVVGFPKAANPLSSASNAGKTVVYNMGDTTWQRLGQEIYGQSRADIDGSSVAMSNDGIVIAIGGKGRSLVNATTGEVIAKSVGYCRIYKLEDGMWELKHSIWGETAEERQGSSVAVSPDGSVVACGGVNGENGDDAARSGVVRLWNLATSEESAIWPRGSDDEVEGVTFGTSIALSRDGGYVVVGAPTWSGDGNGGTFAGAIQIFRDDA